MFFQRVEFELDGFAIDRGDLERSFGPIAERFGMQVSVRFSDDRPRLAVLASRAPHCLIDLLSRWRSGELPADLALVASNHPDHAELAAYFGVPYRHLPVHDDPVAQESALSAALQEERIDLVVLARYMRILSPPRVSHRDGVDDLARKGRDLEVIVLARALRAHLENRVLAWGNRTVVFD